MEKDFLTGLRWALMDWRRLRIKAARIERGMSAQQVADAAGWGITTQRNIESGSRNVKDAELWAIARALGIDVDYFLDEDVRPFPRLPNSQASTPAVEDRPATASSTRKPQGNPDKLLDSAGRRSQKRARKK